MKLSVMIMAYNHAGFIAQAVEGALMQHTAFDYEVLVGEDLSKDSTRQVLLDLQQKYPGRLTLLLNETNLGMHKNFAQLLAACRGEYVALLEGDDFWTSVDKLQKQVEFLDQHPDFAMCFHNVRKIYEDGSQPPVLYCADTQPAVSTLKDLLAENFVPTCSIVFRRSVLPVVPAWTTTLPMLDWSLLVLFAAQGKIGYLNEVMGVYRVHAGGVWSNQRYLQKLVGSVRFLTVYRGSLAEGAANQELLQRIDAQIATFWQTIYQELYDRVEGLPSVEESIQFIDQEIGKFPPNVQFPDGLRRKLYGQVYAMHGFRYYRSGEYAKTRYCWRHAIRNDLSWLKNPGVLSIYLKSFLGVH